MSRILIYTSPAAGHAFPAVAILEQLQARGHHVVIRTLAGLLPALRANGVDAEPIDEGVEAIAMQDWRARTQPGALKLSVRTFVARAAIDGPDLAAAISAHRPDALLVDINSWGALAVAEQWGGAWAAFCPYPLAMSSVDTPPFGLGLPPARNRLGAARDAVLRPLVYGSLGRAMLPGTNAVRAARGLPVLRHVDDQFRRPPLLISMSAPPFDYLRRDWPDSIVQVGPCEWEPAADGALDLDDRPLVLVSTSSEAQADAGLLRAAATGLAEEPVQVVMTAPVHGVLRDVPGNVVSAGFVPHGPLLDRAVCAITHAGMGATQKALARAVPVVAVPYGRDQFEVARRVAVARAGVRMSHRRLSPRTIREAVARAREMRPGAERVAEGFKRAGGARAAAEAVEGLLGARPAGVTR